MIGIDKFKINKIKPLYIDVKKFLSNECEAVSISFAKDGEIYIPIGETNITHLTIKDISTEEYPKTLFNSFKCGLKKDRGTYIPYCIMDLCISNNGNNNLSPLSVGEYISRLEEIRIYLENRYGLYVSFKDVTFSQMELNVTQKMAGPTNNYFQVLNLMRYLAPHNYVGNRPPCFNELGVFTGFYMSNKSTYLKVYDKTNQLADLNIKADGEYLRIEYTLKTTDRIKRALGTNKLADLTDNAICTFLYKQINKELIKPLEKHLEAVRKELASLFESIRNSTKRGYVKEFTTTALARSFDDPKHKTIPLVFDIQLIKDIVAEADKPHKSRNMKVIDKVAIELKATHLIDNLTKFNEIKEKFIKH